MEWWCWNGRFFNTIFALYFKFNFFLFKIQRNEADFYPIVWTCGHPRPCECLPYSYYTPYYIIQAFPEPKSKFWNIIRILNPDTWMMTIITIVSLIVFLKIAVCAGERVGLKTITEELILIPFR